MALLMKPEPFAVEFNRLFDTLFQPASGTTSRWIPAMDLVEAEDHFVLKADLPGLDEDAVSIEVQDNVLTVSGERRDSTDEKADGYFRVERAFGSFSRSLALPDGIDADRVTADFDDGVLEIRIPKPDERRPHRVAIGDGSVEGKAEPKE